MECAHTRTSLEDTSIYAVFHFCVDVCIRGLFEFGSVKPILLLLRLRLFRYYLTNWSQTLGGDIGVEPMCSNLLSLAGPTYYSDVLLLSPEEACGKSLSFHGIPSHIGMLKQRMRRRSITL